jgi:hypothetical protein
MFNEKHAKSGDANNPCRIMKFRQFDFLGEPVTFNYKGNVDYESTLGAICSIVVVLIFLVYIGSALMLMAT